MFFPLLAQHNEAFLAQYFEAFLAQCIEAFLANLLRLFLLMYWGFSCLYIESFLEAFSLLTYHSSKRPFLGACLHLNASAFSERIYDSRQSTDVFWCFLEPKLAFAVWDTGVSGRNGGQYDSAVKYGGFQGALNWVAMILRDTFCILLFAINIIIIMSEQSERSSYKQSHMGRLDDI